MEVFFTLFFKLLPLYGILFLGYLGAKRLDAQKETVASILIYLVVPFVFFMGGYKVELSAGVLLLPLMVYAICAIVAIIFLQIGKWAFKDSSKNLLPLAAALGNTGYFGLPVVLLLFGEDVFVIATVATLGDAIFGNSLGFYIASRGKYSAKESMMRVLKLPAIYAFLVGLFFNKFGISIGASVASVMDLFKGAYSVLGLMIVGMGLGATKLKHIDFKFLGLSFLGRFVAWPLLVLALIYIDKSFWGVLTEDMQKVLMLFAMCPLAANTVAFATELKLHPEKASITVFASTIFALFYIPLMTVLFLS